MRLCLRSTVVGLVFWCTGGLTGGGRGWSGMVRGTTIGVTITGAVSGAGAALSVTVDMVDPVS